MDYREVLDCGGTLTIGEHQMMLSQEAAAREAVPIPRWAREELNHVEKRIEQEERKMLLSSDSAARKASPICSGVIDYFPLALAAVARLSKLGNDKHNPGQPLHWAREKSTDHADCILRHLIDRDTVDPDSGELHAVGLAWRALALLQLAEERRLAR